MSDGAMESIIRRISDRLDDVARDMVARYREEIVDYSTLDEEILYGDVAAVSRGNLEVLLDRLRSGRAIRAEDVDQFREAAARRVNQGISLESLLQAYRMWGQVVWRTILDTARSDRRDEREAALEMAGRVIEHINAVSTAVAQAYLDEAEGVWSDREVIRRDLLEALIAGKGPSDPVRAQAAPLGLDLREDYVVVLAARAEAAPQPGAGRTELRAAVDAAKVHLRPASGSLLVGVRHGEVVTLYPAADAASVDRLKQQAGHLAAEAGLSGFGVGIGGWHRGPAGVAVSYTEAREALDIGLRQGVLDHAVAFDDVLLDHIVRSSPRSERLVGEAVAPLRDYDVGHGTELVPTLRAYFQSGFNLTRSAASLRVHPNTVVYRLRRIKELTGRDPHDPDDLLLLCLGLKLDNGTARVVGAPRGRRGRATTTAT